MFGLEMQCFGRRVTPVLIVTAFVLVQSLLPIAAVAEEAEDDKGFYLGLKFMGSSLHTDPGDDEAFFIKDDGGGVVLDIGYRFNPAFMLELSVGGANHETSDPKIDARFETVQFFGYYRFSPERPFRPYLKGGFGGYGLLVEEGSVNWRVEGGGVALGGGFRYFFSPHFSLGLDFTHNIVRYDKATIGIEGLSYQWAIDENGSMTSLGLQFGYSF
jgi:hypothetical protein